jgi:hypothetical protein
MFTAWYELNIVTIIQVGRLSIVINLCGIMDLKWNNGEEAVGGECSWAIPVSENYDNTNTLSSAKRIFVSFLSPRCVTGYGRYVKF